jgi:hypothetical protein
MKPRPFVTNVVLTADLCEYLDQQSLAVRRTAGVCLNRSQVLRGILAGLKAIPMDFSQCSSEDGIGSGLADFLRRRVQG